MDHKILAKNSFDYPDYLEAVATCFDAREILQSILWHMDDDDKLNILAPAVRELDFEVYDESEYDDFLEEEADRLLEEDDDFE